MNDFSTQFRGLNLREMPEEREGLLQGESNDELLDPAEQYENTVVSCEFGKFQILLLFVCGWAVASDSVEIQVNLFWILLFQAAHQQFVYKDSRFIPYGFPWVTLNLMFENNRSVAL